MRYLLRNPVATRIPVLVATALALSVLLPTAAAAAEGGMINLDKSLAVQVVNFLLLLVLLYRFLYRPLLLKLEERSTTIKKALEEAQAARAEAQRQQEEHQAMREAARAEAQAMREAALKEVAEERQRLIEVAREEATRLVESARAEIARDIRRARQELRREVGDLAVSIAERLIRKSLREEDHRRIVQETIGQMERTG